ncbi:hypothetical protein BRD56_02030 [Thermoplasmatales archaeon SW_10_69_26]|nr:MAG: hypothetical protein BRD56_02030 [Thermoplasmatales archaeon SW_10_69_26]
MSTSSDEASPTPEEPGSVQAAVDELRTGSPTPRGSGPSTAEPQALPEPVRERIRKALDDVAYAQHAYESREHHVCFVGVRSQASIEETVVVAGPEGVAGLDEIRDRVDELRRGEDPTEVAGLLDA